MLITFILGYESSSQTNPKRNIANEKETNNKTWLRQLYKNQTCCSSCLFFYVRMKESKRCIECVHKNSRVPTQVNVIVNCLSFTLIIPSWKLEIVPSEWPTLALAITRRLLKQNGHSAIQQHQFLSKQSCPWKLSQKSVGHTV